MILNNLTIQEEEVLERSIGTIKNYQFDGYISSAFSDKNYNNKPLNHLVEYVKNSDGCYRLIIKSSDMDIAIVDRIRSLPIFYKVGSKGIEISTQLNNTHGSLLENNIDTFRYTGFVTGNETLCEEWKQLLPGELLVFDYIKNIFFTVKYFEYQYSNQSLSNSWGEEEYIKKQNDAVNNAIELAISAAENKEHIMLPLSGGEDSRLILTKLKEYGINNIVAYTFGLKGNKEARISQLVANYYGVPWKFIEYTKETWAKQREPIKDYYAKSSNVASLPHIMEYPAVKMLSQNYDLSNCIFMPGHSLDFLAGSHIQERFITQQKVSLYTLAQLIVDKHYLLWPVKNKNQCVEEVFQQLRQQTEKETLLSLQALELFERWNWENRQAKFIVNSVRLYEYFGASWALPLWHNALFDFWLSMDIEQRFQRNLFYRYIENNYYDLRCHLEERIDLNQKSLWSNLPLGLKKKLKSFNNKYKAMRGNYYHPMGWYGLVEDDHLHKKFSSHSSVNSYVVDQYLSLLS